MEKPTLHYILCAEVRYAILSETLDSEFLDPNWGFEWKWICGERSLKTEGWMSQTTETIKCFATSQVRRWDDV